MLEGLGPSRAEMGIKGEENHPAMQPKPFELESWAYERRKAEVGLVLKNPETTGINVDTRYIVHPVVFWSKERTLKVLGEVRGWAPEEYHELVPALFEEKIGQRVLGERRKEEEQKVLELQDYLDRFQGRLKHLRINPAGETSPVNPTHAVEAREDGSFSVSLDPYFVEQMQIIFARSSDVSLVVPFFDHRRGREEASNVPETREQVEQYIGIGKALLRTFGEKVQLEVGNEVNIARSSDPHFAEELQHATEVDPLKYARFYAEVSSALKKEFPNARIALSGVAVYDPEFLRTVLGEVKEFEGRQNLPRLVDAVGFHPYRETPEKGAFEVREGKFFDSNLSYLEQLREIKEIAQSYRPGVRVNVGEINFRFDDPEAIQKLAKSNQLTAREAMVSYIYPVDPEHRAGKLPKPSL